MENSIGPVLQSNNKYMFLDDYQNHDILIYKLRMKSMHITKTYLYKSDPLKPDCYIVKLGFTGVYIIFLISDRRGGSNEYPQSMLWAEIWKISEFFVWKFSVFGDEIFNKFE